MNKGGNMNEITEGNFPEVRSRQEMYLQDIIKSLSNESISDNNYPDPLSRQEAYLQIIISKLRANDPNIEINTEDIEKAVNKYLEQNPIQPGATENQAQQIEKNKKDVASLKKRFRQPIQFQNFQVLRNEQWREPLSGFRCWENSGYDGVW